MYNNGVVLNIQGYYNVGIFKDAFSSQPNNGAQNNPPERSNHTENMQSSGNTTAKGGNPEESHADAKPSAGVHVSKDMTITNVMADSPAHKAGLMVNDIILAFDGTSVTDTTALKRLTDTAKAGDRKMIRIQRGDKVLELTIYYPKTGDGK